MWERSREIIWKNDGPKLPNFEERREHNHPRNSTNPKQNKLKETHNEAHYNPTVESQQQRHNLKSSKRKVSQNIDEIPYKISY